MNYLSNRPSDVLTMYVTRSLDYDRLWTPPQLTRLKLNYNRRGHKCKWANKCNSYYQRITSLDVSHTHSNLFTWICKCVQNKINTNHGFATVLQRVQRGGEEQRLPTAFARNIVSIAINLKTSNLIFIANIIIINTFNLLANMGIFTRVWIYSHSHRKLSVIVVWGRKIISLLSWLVSYVACESMVITKFIY